MTKGVIMNKTIMYGVGITTLAIAGLAIVPSLASAQTNNANTGSGYQQMLQTKADLIGITKDELSNQLETKTLEQIAEEKGINEDQIHAAMQKAAEKRWAEKVLTEAEIAERLAEMKTRQTGDHEANSVTRGQGRGSNHVNQ